MAWIRRSRVETDDGRVEDTLWCVTFDEEAPRVRRGAATDQTLGRGEVDGLSWELEWRELAPPFVTPHRALRRVAPSGMETLPALVVSGRIGDRRLEHAPGHSARLWGKRHATTWGWAHASAADGRWAHLLTVTAPRLPRLSQHATQRGGPGLPIARASVEPPRVAVGPYAVEAPSASFVGLRYLDTDGSTVWCYHSEAAQLEGMSAALEIGVREPIAGWAVEP